MKVRIKEQEVELRYSMRSLFMFERVANKSFNPTTIEDFCTFFYCVVCSSNKDLDLTFDEFVDYLDEEPSKMNEFAEWLSKTMQKSNFLSGAAQSQEKESKGKGNKKKP